MVAEAHSAAISQLNVLIGILTVIVLMATLGGLMRSLGAASASARSTSSWRSTPEMAEVKRVIDDLPTDTATQYEEQGYVEVSNEQHDQLLNAMERKRDDSAVCGGELVAPSRDVRPCQAPSLSTRGLGRNFPSAGSAAA